MIKANTVFVVGAGASKPHGFPTGRELLRLFKGAGLNLVASRLPSLPNEEAVRLTDALRGSEDDSIDALLEYRPDLETPGKILMASELLLREQRYWENPDRDGDWIQYVIARMTDGSGSVEEFAANNGVTFVTYNYDRLIEYKLSSHLAAKWRATPEQQQSALSRIPVIHLHGSLGHLGSVPFGGLDFSLEPVARGPEIDRNGLRAAKEIRIVHQVAKDDAVFSQAREALSRAATVYFLGFGFGQRNVERLNLSAIGDKAVIYTTCFGLTGQEYSRIIESPLRAAGRYIGGAADADVGCLDMLRQFGL